MEDVEVEAKDKESTYDKVPESKGFYHFVRIGRPDIWYDNRTKNSTTPDTLEIARLKMLEHERDSVNVQD